MGWTAADGEIKNLFAPIAAVWSLLDSVAVVVDDYV